MTAPTATRNRWRYPYEPEPRQLVLHQCDSDEILYGGRPGGGKTDALLGAGVNLCLAVPGVKVLLLRRTFPELEQEILPRLKERIPRSIARYNSQHHTFTFWNGSILRLGYLEHADDVYRYSGAEYQLILWDELTQFDHAQYEFLRTRLRAAGRIATALRALGTRPRMMGATNPGGRGHSWVKAMYVDPAPAEQEHLDPDGLTRTYIPAKASDNSYLDQVEYDKQLNAISDPILRRAMRDGDWDILSGARFASFRRDLHTVRPEQVPLPLVGYPRAVGVDFGTSAPFAAVWGCLVGRTVVIYRELYRKELTASQQVALLLASEAPGERLPSRPIPVALDPSTWTRHPEQLIPGVEGAPPVGSVAHTYHQRLGGQLRKGNNARLSGWALVDEYLAVNEATGLPGLLIYDTCTQLIRTLPSQMRSKTNPEDVNTKGEDHMPDALRYLLYELVGGGHSRTADDTAGPRDPLLASSTGHLAGARF